MLYLKSYCYSQHELAFVIANLIEGWDYIEKLCLYEYNYTHTGIKKDYELEKVIQHVPENLREKLYYKKIDLTNYVEYAYDNGPLIHRVNEPIQRSWLFNDPNFNLKDDDIIIDHDIDEIIYKNSYIPLIEELNKKGTPLSIKLNQFFFKNNYLWTNCNFSSPTIYKYNMVKNMNQVIKGINIKNLRDLPNKTSSIYGCHMSWIMPIENMLKKFHQYSHPEFRKFANKELLEKAIKDKVYVFDLKRPFIIDELNINDDKIPSYLQKENIFYYME